MARARESRSRVTGHARTAPAPARTTRELLIELAAQVFATEGYASASVRDLGRRLGVTSGALYGNFRGKADLLAEAVDARLTADLWTLPDDVTSKSLIDIVAYQFEHYETRTQLMSLLLEGALAARTDSDVHQRLQETLGRRIDASSRAFESRREAEGFDPTVDLAAAVKIFYSIEIGLRALSALGVDSPDPESCADVVRRFAQGLQPAQSPQPRRGRGANPAKKPAARHGSAANPNVAAEPPEPTGSTARKVAKPIRKGAKKVAAKARF